MSKPPCRFALSWRAGQFIVLAVLASLAAPAAAQQELEALAEELVQIRGEVESLNERLTGLREQHRAEMSSLAAQKGDLEATRRREALRIQQLEQDLGENRERAAQAGVAGEALV
ncbi:MAG: hypothetical protein R3323_07885, partial [Wenzhouxiangellaceae bacterium]|nr:hypothetical protein [Wenzhouxiangellaceae bacterium]